MTGGVATLTLLVTLVGSGAAVAQPGVSAPDSSSAPPAVAPVAEESGPSTPDGPTPELVDRIVAIVDEEPILLSDLEREIESARFEAEALDQPLPDDPAELRAQMLDRLIEVKLLVAKAKQDGLVIGDEEIEAEVTRSMQQLIDRFGTRAALEKELANSGMTYADLVARNRELVRNRLYMMRMVQAYVRPKVEVRDDEVAAYYREHQDQLPHKPERARLAHILIVPQPAPEVMAEVQRKLSEIRQKLLGGARFEELAREYSEGPGAANGGFVGRFAKGDLFSPILEEAAWRLPVGQVSDPINTELGVHLIQVTERTNSEVALRQILLRVQVGAAERAAARARAEEVVRLLDAGQDFATLAKSYSDDPGTRDKGGEMGVIEVERLDPRFVKALKDVPAGGHTGVIEGSQGFFVLKVLERMPGDAYSFDEVKDRIRALLMDQRSEEELERFVQGLREQFYIEIKA